MGGLTVTLGFMHELLVGESSSKLQHLDAGKTRDRLKWTPELGPWIAEVKV
jgi:hypothetical protein